MTYSNPLQEKLRQLDQRLKRNMVGMKPLHHSTGDWDFSSSHWVLDSSVYVSAPSSLRTIGDAGEDIIALVKTTTVPIDDVKEGRISSYFRFSAVDDNHFRIIFRYQDANNFYYVRFRPNMIPYLAIIQKVANVDTTLAFSNDNIWVPGVWHLVRVTWWNDYVGLVIRVERWVASAWNIVLDAYDALNYWKDIGGRVGITLLRRWATGTFTWADDTYIYGIPSP